MAGMVFCTTVREAESYTLFHSRRETIDNTSLYHWMISSVALLSNFGKVEDGPWSRRVLICLSRVFWVVVAWFVTFF